MIHPAVAALVAASSSNVAGRVMSGLLGVMFVVYGVWRLRLYLHRYYPRGPRDGGAGGPTHSDPSHSE